VFFGGAAAGADCGAFEGELRRWERSGDAAGLLPPAELRRLVGFKVPARGLLAAAAPRGARPPPPPAAAVGPGPGAPRAAAGRRGG
jgi:hypothetical protein